MEKQKLIVKDNSIYTIEGKYLGSISMTDRAKELLDDDGWDKGNESWLSYRKRTKTERDLENKNQLKLASDIVTAYNEKYFNQ